MDFTIEAADFAVSTQAAPTTDITMAVDGTRINIALASNRAAKQAAGDGDIGFAKDFAFDIAIASN